MALNQYFLQGSPNEQRLIQELINEQLRIYGVEVIYIPRKFVRKETILKEVSSSKFDDNFALEAYVNNYEGYTGAGDVLTKFGVSLRDELSLIISKERFEDFIAPFLASMDPEEIELATRPREGDIIYFPLGQRLFEVKFVEHEQPFYQLGKLYVYELKCELFEYEDEVIDTTIDEVDQTIQDQGYIATVQLISSGVQAAARTSLTSGYIKNIYLLNDGYDYTSVPTVAIGTAPSGGYNASAVAITTSIKGLNSVKGVYFTNTGFGYTVAPSIQFIGGGGSGAAATCQIETTNFGIQEMIIDNNGTGYATNPVITFSAPPVGWGITATGIATVSNGSISQILITNPGLGYTVAPTITIDPPSITVGVGTYIFNEIVVGSKSKVRARVKSWDKDTNLLEVSITDGQFYPGELIVGTASSATYAVQQYESDDLYNKYEENREIETEADFILDFSETNPFGNY
jgi:hypothetical protein